MSTIREADFWNVYRDLHPGEKGNPPPQPDAKGLFDGLEAKRKLVTLLENGGHIKHRDAEHLRLDIDKALHELDVILRACPHGGENS